MTAGLTFDVRKIDVSLALLARGSRATRSRVRLARGRACGGQSGQGGGGIHGSKRPAEEKYQGSKAGRVCCLAVGREAEGVRRRRASDRRRRGRTAGALSRGGAWRPETGPASSVHAAGV